MSVFDTRPALRWLVPATAAVVVIGGGAAVGTLSANAEPSLPARSAAQLLVDLQTARLDGLSGTVVQRADLGLPALPNLGASTSTDLASLVSGTHTLRVWYAGPDQARVALLGTLGESDLIRNGRDLWTWNSQTNSATHSTLPATDGRSAPVPPTGLPSTPQEAASQALAAIEPSTEVTVGRSATIAGRDAYELVLSPRDESSLVAQVRVAIDAEEHVPLRFELFAKGAEEPVFETAFTQVDFDRPSAEQFTFNPPPGAKVTEQSTDRPDRAARGKHTDGQRPDAPTVVGTGWTTVGVFRMPGKADLPASPDGTDRAEQFQVGRLLDQLPKVSGAWGSGRLVTTKVFSVLITDDGRVLVGAVTPQRLYEVAQSGK